MALTNVYFMIAWCLFHDWKDAIFVKLNFIKLYIIVQNYLNKKIREEKCKIDFPILTLSIYDKVILILKCLFLTLLKFVEHNIIAFDSDSIVIYIVLLYNFIFVKNNYISLFI